MGAEKLKIMDSLLSYYSRERKKGKTLRSNSGASGCELWCGSIEGKIIYGNFKMGRMSKEMDIICNISN